MSNDLNNNFLEVDPLDQREPEPNGQHTDDNGSTIAVYVDEATQLLVPGTNKPKRTKKSKDRDAADRRFAHRTRLAEEDTTTINVTGPVAQEFDELHSRLHGQGARFVKRSLTGDLVTRAGLKVVTKLVKPAFGFEAMQEQVDEDIESLLAMWTDD